jgi:hypothetical protein
MPLSISKLQNFLASKQLQVNKLFVLDGYLFYMELISLNSGDVFFLYIPSKYDIQVEKNDNTYKMKYLDISNSENIADEYGENKEDDGPNILVSTGKENMEEHLENNYKKAIPIGEISEEDTKELKTIHRQMKRLKNCVENIDYKLSISYKNYMCSIRRDNSIDFFSVKDFPRKDSKQLFVVIDLETLYEKNEEIIKDIQIVKQSIYRVLERNQNTHTYVLDRLINNKADIYNIPHLSEKKKIKYELLMGELEHMLTIMNKAEIKIKDNIENLDKIQKDGLQSDINRVHEKSRLEKELFKIQNIKDEIIRNMNIIRDKRENTILNVDNIMFDNTVMFDSMIKNFSKLKYFC